MSTVNTPYLALLITMVLYAAMSAWFMTDSVNAGDVGSASGWAAVFLGTSLLAAWLFWRLV